MCFSATSPMFCFPFELFFLISLKHCGYERAAQLFRYELLGFLIPFLAMNAKYEGKNRNSIKNNKRAKRKP